MFLVTIYISGAILCVWVEKKVKMIYNSDKCFVGRGGYYPPENSAELRRIYKMNRITSFSVDHDLLTEGIYVSRIDGDITTYDMRTRVPNSGDFMDTTTAHTVEHMFATFVRNSEISDDVIYFGPMGCRTGFYLLVRNADNAKILEITKKILADIIAYDGEVFGNTRKECGNYLDLDLEKAKAECRRYLKALEKEQTFKYRK